MLRRTLVLGFGFALAVSQATGHEFWIEPVAFQVEEGTPLKARMFVGQMMKGEEYPYLSSTFKRFTLSDQETIRSVPGTLGDRPALSMSPARPGLHIVAYQSKPSRTRYTTFDKFEKFLDKEGLSAITDAHRARGLPDENFQESYTRFAKSLIAVGDGAGTDIAVGFRFELIALSNPYTEDGFVSVELRFNGKLQADSQIAVFRRAEDGDVTREVLWTGPEGRAIISRKAGVTLLSAVKMVEPAPNRNDLGQAVWHSLWASLTFRDFGEN